VQRMNATAASRFLMFGNNRMRNAAAGFVKLRFPQMEDESYFPRRRASSASAPAAMPLIETGSGTGAAV